MKYTIWKPSGLVKNKLYDVISIHDVYEGFDISMIDDENQKLTFTWNSVIESYMRSSEETRFKFISNEWKTLAEENCGWSFYEVIDSDYCAWVQRESDGFIDKEELHHLMIVAENDVVDIVSYDYPVVTLGGAKNEFS